jgi:predicted RNA methylase
MEQKHLSPKDTVNLGSYYTPTWLVDIVYSLLDKNVSSFSDYYILDTSCGYGGFLRGQKAIGADIDSTAIETAKTASSQVKYFNHNSLLGISRAQYGLEQNAKMIIVGNPPYNDTTSMIRNDIKETEFLRDAEVMSRDLGISFLLSYDKLEADYVCVLHPLSYLIKKANFEALMSFKNNYKLIDSVVISSGVFSATSKTTSFPIVIALYERVRPRGRQLFGMDYNYIQNYKFNTNDNKVFSIKEYDPIGNYISKYPNKKTVSEKETIAYFYTMRDINALKRTATFLKDETGNAVRVTKQKLPYYCYVDVFKDYIPHIPYYFGNSDVFIDNDGFSEVQAVFMNRSVEKHPKLRPLVECKKYNDTEREITGYFRQLLGEHYNDLTK